MAGKPRSAPPAHHGTRARYHHHLRHKEVPCDACTRANTEYGQRRRRALHHSGSTDLYPVIALLARALLGDQPGPEWDREAAMGDAF